MSLIQGNAIEGAGYEIQKSLRFRASASAYLSRTPTVAGNRRTWTWSGWVKRGLLSGSATYGIIEGNAGATDLTAARFLKDTLSVQDYSNAGGYFLTWVTTAVFRDASAWYHIVIAYDTTQASSANAVKFYVNGVQQSLTFTAVAGAYVQNRNSYINATNAQRIGVYNGLANYFDGYLFEINFIDGQALDPSYFGEFSAETGAWIPKKYTGAYGTNGFYLPFNDGSNLTNLTADSSGNGNNWTANNISLTPGVTYDWMDDTPTNNFAVLNPLNRQSGSSAAVLTDGNLKITVPSGVNATPGAFAISTGTFLMASGKWYFEATGIQVSGAAGGMYAGVTNQLAYSFNGTNYYHGSFTSQFKGQASASDGVMIAYDADNGLVWVGKNGTWDAGNPSTGTGGTSFAGPCIPFVEGYNDTANRVDAVANFGQRPFAYTPPAGFKALCTANLPTPSILNPSNHFQIKLAAGASIKSTTDAVFSGQILEVIKDRANSNNWQWMDNARNLAGNVLQSNTTVAETGYVAPAGNSVGYTWKSGGWPVSNTAGTVTSKVSANVSAGFSIVTFTAPASGVFSVGHGLGVAPKMWILKSTTSGDGWYVGHASLPVPATDYLSLQSTSGKFSLANMWGASGPSSTLLSALVGGGAPASQSCVAYCFAEIPGYSKIGSYTGNGSADGPFVWCGFRPKWVMIKRTDVADDWEIRDVARDTYNVQTFRLRANQSAAEVTTAGDFYYVSNGFKVRNNNSAYNTLNGTYIFIAFAEAPFKFANAR